MKRIIIFTFLCLLYSCNVFNLEGGDSVLQFGTKDGASDPNTGLDAWGYDPLSATHVSAWNMPATDLTLTLPITDSSSLKYDFTIDWGDGTVEQIGSAATTGLDLRGSDYDKGIEPLEISHTYTTAGIYTIEITGTFEEWSFLDFDINGINATSTSNDHVNLIRVHSFGDLGFESLSNAFRDCTNLTLFAGGYTQNVTSMTSMFFGAPSLTSLDLSSFNTSSVTDMSDMFTGTSSLTSLDLSNFDTSSVTYMSNMFFGASSLTSLDLSSFNTSSVTDMSYMFTGASSLTSLDLSNFDTSSVTDMSGMFSGASGLTSLDLSNFNTSSVTNMGSMFFGASGLTSLDLSSFDTSSVIHMNYMFRDTSSLTSLDLSSFNTSSLTNMSHMFFGASGLTSLDLTNWDTDPQPSSTSWISGMTGTIICNDPDSGGTGAAGDGTVNGVACN